MSESTKRIVLTGMAVNTRLGDDPDTFVDNLIAGKSGITNWTCVDTSNIYSKVGGDLSGYDVAAKLAKLEAQLPLEIFKPLRRLVKKAPFTTRLSMLTACDAYLDAKLHGELDPNRWGIIVGGHNLAQLYRHANQMQFQEEPDFIDSLASLLGLDTDHAGSVGEVLGCLGPIYTMGGACASGNVALRNAVDEIRYHDYDAVMVVGAALEFAPMDLHAMALMGAITFSNFVDEPERASRPYDKAREGFVPSHGTGALVVESLEHAQRRGATIHAEVLHVTALSDGCHLPQPSEEGQSRTMTRLFAKSGVAPEEVDYVCAHATSTPLGDLTEMRSIKKVFGAHAKRLKINAPKSMLGHTCWSAPTIETVAAIMQMKRGVLHPSVNIDDIDDEVDLDVCANKSCKHEVRTILKNSFGFGGINCCALLRRFDG